MSSDPSERSHASDAQTRRGNANVVGDGAFSNEMSTNGVSLQLWNFENKPFARNAGRTAKTNGILLF